MYKGMEKALRIISIKKMQFSLHPIRHTLISGQSQNLNFERVCIETVNYKSEKFYIILNIIMRAETKS